MPLPEFDNGAPRPVRAAGLGVGSRGFARVAGAARWVPRVGPRRRRRDSSRRLVRSRAPSSTRIRRQIPDASRFTRRGVSRDDVPRNGARPPARLPRVGSPRGPSTRAARPPGRDTARTTRGPVDAPRARLRTCRRRPPRESERPRSRETIFQKDLLDGRSPRRTRRRRASGTPRTCFAFLKSCARYATAATSARVSIRSAEASAPSSRATKPWRPPCPTAARTSRGF